MKIKGRAIRKQILKKLTAVTWREISEGTSNIQYLNLRRLFFKLFEKESKSKEPVVSIEEKEKAILSQAFLIMNRIYSDSDAIEVFDKDMGDSTKDITETSDFLEFIGKLLLK